MKAIPLFGDEGKVVKGMQLIINLNKRKGNILLNFIDHTFDQMAAKYESTFLRFDIKKIFCDD